MVAKNFIDMSPDDIAEALHHAQESLWEGISHTRIQLDLETMYSLSTPAANEILRIAAKMNNLAG